MTGNICDSPAAVNGDATPSQKKFRLKAKIHKAHGDRRRRLTYADACVAYFIIDWFNPAKGCSWPSLETLAEATGLNLRTVKRSIARLVRLGVIKKKTRGRRGHTSEYVPNWEYGGEPDTQKYGGEPDTQTADMVTSLSSFGGEAGQNKVASSPPHTLPPRSDSVGVVVADAAALAPGGARDRVGEGAASNGAVPDDNQLELEFKAWWPACPRKEGRAAAKKEFFAARRRGVPFETLMDGMRRFAAAKANVEQRYIKLPANWLKEECWGDDPQPPQPKAPKRERVSKGKANPKANGKAEPVEPIEPVEPDDDDDDEFTPEEIAKEAGFPIGTCVWVRHSGLKGEIVGAEISDDYSYRLTVDYRSSGGSIARGIEPVGLTLEDPFTPEQRAEMATRAAEKEAAREAERKKRDAEWQRQRLAEEGYERTLARFPIGSHVDSIYRGDRVHGEVLEVCPGGSEIRVAWGRWPGDTYDVVSIDYLVRS